MAAPTDTLCMAAADCTCNFAPLRLKRRAMNPNDVVIDMRWCGVCHSDVHIAQGMVSVVAKVAYPIVPGHELAGVVSAVGASSSLWTAQPRTRRPGRPTHAGR